MKRLGLVLSLLLVMVVAFTGFAHAQVTDAYFTKICSTNAAAQVVGGCENLAYGASMTQYDHGGAVAYVDIIQIGFGDTFVQFASIYASTIVIPATSNLLMSQSNVCRISNQITVGALCNGQTIIGYSKRWNIASLLQIHHNAGASVGTLSAGVGTTSGTIKDTLWVHLN